MNNFELIDDYLANRLEGKAREMFESQLSTDPALNSELEIQRQIVDGIKQARAAELKAMLSQVPVTSGVQIEISVLRIAAGLLLAGVVSAATYYYFNPSEFPPIDNAAADVAKPEPKDESPVPGNIQPDADQDEPAAVPGKKNDAKQKPGVKEESTPAVKPELHLVDPSADLEESEQPSNERPGKAENAEISPSHVQIDMDSSNKRYDFHYQFSDDRLMLYGSFDRSLYEVLEINGDEHTLFLYYKNNFYLLDENQEQVTKLNPVKDQALLKKLREYRSK